MMAELLPLLDGLASMQPLKEHLDPYNSVSALMAWSAASKPLCSLVFQVGFLRRTIRILHGIGTPGNTEFQVAVIG